MSTQFKHVLAEVGGYAGALVAATVGSGWAFALVYYGRLKSDPIEVGVGLGPQGLVPRFAPFSLVLVLTLAGTLWVGGLVVNLEGDDESGNPTIRRNTLFPLVFYPLAALGISIWAWQFWITSPWNDSSTPFRIAIWAALPIAALVLLWVLLAVLIQPGYLPPIKILTVRTVMLAIGLYMLISGSVAYVLAGNVQNGGEISTPVLRTELQWVATSDGKITGCFHHLGSGSTGLSIFYDHRIEKPLKVPTENLVAISGGCDQPAYGPNPSEAES